MGASHKSDRYNIPQCPGDAFEVVPSDATDFVTDSGYADGVHVWTTAEGSLEVLPLGSPGGSTIELTDVPAFTLIPFRVRKVMASSTATCVGII